MDRTPQPLYRQGGVSVWHAEDLDVDSLLESYGQRVGEGVLWLGHCVYIGLAEDARCRDTGRVPLKAEYLRNVIGRHHLDAVRQAAIETGYVDRDRSYRAGDHSQVYWIVPPYSQARLVQRQIANAGLRHNIACWRDSRFRATWQRIQRSEAPVDTDVCAHLWRNLQRVRIDAEIDLGGTFHPAYQIAVGQIRAGDWWFIVDDYGRIHTNLTNLWKGLRQYLSVDGERLANVDISESQPLFLGVEIATSTRRQEARRKGATEETGRKGVGPSALLHMMDNTMMDKNHQCWGGLDRGGLYDELRRYIGKCEARGLYQAVADRLGMTRDAAKQRVMVVLYGKPSLRTLVSAVLDELFPTVMQAMRGIKQQDYRHLAHFAQRIESAFMFGRVVPRIMELRPDLFIATIHDSILTTAGNAEFVRQVMRDEFARLGLAPQVKVESCCEA